MVPRFAVLALYFVGYALSHLFDLSAGSPVFVAHKATEAFHLLDRRLSFACKAVASQAVRTGYHDLIGYLVVFKVHLLHLRSPRICYRAVHPCKRSVQGL